MLPTMHLVYTHSMIFSLFLMACSLIQTVLFQPPTMFSHPLSFYTLRSCRHILRVFITAETDCGPFHQLHPCSEVHCDEGSEPPLPCLSHPLPQGLNTFDKGTCICVCTSVYEIVCVCWSVHPIYLPVSL